MQMLQNRPGGGLSTELASVLFGQQVGCLVASFLSVVVIGCAGYRLFRRKQEKGAGRQGEPDRLRPEFLSASE